MRDPAAVNALSQGMGSLGEYDTWLRAQGLGQQTIDQRVRFAERRLRAWGTWDRSARDLSLWLDQYEGWTRRTYHSHLNSLYDWLVERGELAVSPSRVLRSTALPRPRPRPFAMGEALRIIDAAPEGDWLRPWMQLGLYAGLRSHEIAKVRSQDVSADGLYVLGKGGYADVIPTHPVLLELAGLFGPGYWFPSPFRDRPHLSSSTVTNRTSAHFHSLGHTGSIHRMRSTYATTLLRAGVNIKVIQELLRHRSLAATEHYLGVDDLERVAAIQTLAA